MFNPDALLTFWLAAMFLAKAALIRRVTWLGRSMMVCNTVLGALFLYSGVSKAQGVAADPHVLNVFRLLLGLCVTWVIVELLKEARNRWSLLP